MSPSALGRLGGSDRRVGVDDVGVGVFDGERDLADLTFATSRATDATERRRLRKKSNFWPGIDPSLRVPGKHTCVGVLGTGGPD